MEFTPAQRSTAPKRPSLHGPAHARITQNPGARLLLMHPTRLRLAAATVSLGLVPALLSITGAVAGEANAAPRRTARRSPAPSTASRTSWPRTGARSASATATPPRRPRSATSPTRCSPAAASGRATSARTSAYDDHVTLTGDQPADRRALHRHPQPPGRRGAARRPAARPRAAGHARWSTATSPASTSTSATSAAHGVKDPTCKGAGYIKPDATALDLWYGVYVGQPARLHRGLRAADRRGRPAESPADPGIPELPVDATFADAARRAARPAGAAGGPGQGPEVAVRLQRHRRRRQRHHHRARHGARQPALPVARPLPLRPSSHLTIPGTYDVAGAQPDRLAGGQHRLEQERRLEPHGLHGLPLHAVRVQDAAAAPRLPHRPRAPSSSTTATSRSRSSSPTARCRRSRRTSTAPTRATSSTTPTC